MKNVLMGGVIIQDEGVSSVPWLKRESQKNRI